MRLKNAYGRSLHWMLNRQLLVITGVVLLVMGSALLFPRIGTELFPRVDVGQFAIQMRAPSGTRIEITEEYVTQIEEMIREVIPPSDLQMIISNTGVLYDWPAAYTLNAGPMDSEFMVQLTEDHQVSSFEYVRSLREKFREKYPFS